MKRGWLVILAVTLALPSALRAQRVRVAARVSPALARVGDMVIVDITVVTSGPAPESIEMPSLPAGLRLTGSKDFTEYAFRLPGGRVRTTRRELTLTAAAPGHYVIPPLVVVVDGVAYRTRPLRLDVAAYTPPATPPGGVGLASGPDDEVLLQSWATPDTVWVGQQITVRADALFAADISGRLAAAPQYEGAGGPGFWVYDLGSETAPELRPVRGRMYQVQTFRRAFFPLSAGRLVIPGAHLSYAVRRGFLSGSESYELNSDSMPVVVRALPRAGRPEAFAGAVGDYTISARLEPARVAVGEAATLTVEVRGDGNIKALPPPRLPALAGVRVFSPAEDAEVRTDDEQVGGVKSFTWVLVPSRAGTLAIPPLELPYFDPALRRYQLARTEPLDLSVAPVPAASSGSAGAPTAGVQLRPLRRNDRGARVAAWVRAPAFRALAALPVIALLALGLEGALRRRRRRRPAARPHSGAGMVDRLRREMMGLRAKAGAENPAANGAESPAAASSGAFEGELLRVTGEWLSERLGVPELAGIAGIGAARLDATLREVGVRPVVAVALAALATELEQARYRPAPPTAGERARWVDEAERLLAEVHAGARRHRARAGGSGASALLAVTVGGALAWTLAAAAPGQAQRSGPAPGADAAAAVAPGSGGAGASVLEAGPRLRRDSAFAAAVTAYGRKEYALAADLFAAYAERHPAHSDAWYDLGNAAFRAGQHGRAAWGWLRALELDPRDGDARQNLALAGIDAALVDSVIPPVALSRDELLLLAGIAWLLGAALLLAWRMARRNDLAVIGVVALLVAAAAGGMAGFATLAPPRAIVLDGVPLLGAPNEHADRLGEVIEGSAVRVLERRGGWVHVGATVAEPTGLSMAAPESTGGDPAGSGGSGSREGWIELGRLGPL